MKTPSCFVLSKLSRDLYLNFLASVNDGGFSFVHFRDFLSPAALPNRFIALRHDIDFAPIYALEMAELEHERGVKSTFFVLVDGQFYDTLQSDVILQLRRIHALGHEIGLHFAVSSTVEADHGKEVAFRLQILSTILGQRVESFAQHDVVNDGVVPVTLPSGHYPCVDVRQAILDHNLLYVSDSAMMWRKHTFHTALKENRNLCLLAHPHSWLHPQNDYVAMIRDLESQQLHRVSKNYDAFVDALNGYYERRLTKKI